MITVCELSGGYGEQDILHDLTFSVEKGEFFALLGPNGSGKTTLLNMLTGSLSPSRGEVFVQGEPLSALSALQKARYMTVLTQEPSVAFDFTVEEMVALGRYPHQQGWFKLLSGHDRSVMEEAMRLTRVNVYRHTPFRVLSGGEKQRVLLAKALAQEPRVLLLDEPMNHLDLQHSLHLLSLLKEWQHSKQLTVFAILHDVNVASLYAERIGLLQAGRLVELGDVHVLKKEKRLEDVFQVQLSVQPHRLTSKPQLLLTPPPEEPSQKSFSDLYQVRSSRHGLSVHFSCPLKMMSNAVWGGGTAWASHVCLFHIQGAAVVSQQQRIKGVQQRLEEVDIPAEQTVAMLTPSPVQPHDPIVLEKDIEGYKFMFLLATGMEEAAHIDQEAIRPVQGKMDTVNMMLFIDGHFSESALVQVMMMVMEAKTNALHDLQVQQRYNRTVAAVRPADSVLIGATQRGESIHPAKSGTVLGKGINRLVYEAVRRLEFSPV